MIINISNKTFGSIQQFDSYELEIFKRNKFLPISKKFKIEKYPENLSIDNLTEETVNLSDNFTDRDFIRKTIRGTEDLILPFVGSENVLPEEPKHYFSIKTIYDNLQRLCFEVMEPVYEMGGRRPNIESGLLFRDNLRGVDMDSFFSDQIQGNAVVMNFSNDKNNETINLCANYIIEFSIFDRLLIDNTLKKYDRPTLMVSVNSKKRGIAGYVRRK
jgi:hypothetical protein